MQGFFEVAANFCPTRQLLTPCVCVAASVPAVPSGSDVVITCQKLGATWPEGSFNVTVTASAAVGTDAGLVGCSDAAAGTTQVMVNQLPSLSMTSPLWATLAASGASTPRICSSDTQLNLNYTVRTGSSGLLFSVATSTANCAVTAPAQSSNGETQQPQQPGFGTAAQQQSLARGNLAALYACMYLLYALLDPIRLPAWSPTGLFEASISFKAPPDRLTVCTLQSRPNRLCC